MWKQTWNTFKNKPTEFNLQVENLITKMKKKSSMDRCISQCLVRKTKTILIILYRDNLIQGIGYPGY